MNKKYSPIYIGPKPSRLADIVRMIDILSSTRVAAGYAWKAYESAPPTQWPGTFTAMVRAGARNSAKQVTLSILPGVPTKAFRPPATSRNAASPPQERDTKATHKRRRPARRPAVQAYRVWSKRRQVSHRHAVKLQGAAYMQEVIPAPLEEVFLMEEILPAPLQEFEASGLVHAGAKNSHGLPGTNAPILACNIALGCGHSEPRPDHPSPHSCQPPMSAFCHAFDATSHPQNLVPRATDYWRYVGHPFQSFDRDACGLQPIRPEPSAPTPSLLTSPVDDIGDVSLTLSSRRQPHSPLIDLELGDDNVFLVGGAEHAGVRGHPFVKCTPVPDGFVDGGEDAGGQIEILL